MIGNRMLKLSIISLSCLSLFGCLLPFAKLDSTKVDGSRIIYRDLYRPVIVQQPPRLEPEPMVSPRRVAPAVRTAPVVVPPVAAVLVPAAPTVVVAPARPVASIPAEVKPRVLPSMDKEPVLPRSAEVGCSCAVVR